MVVGVAIIGTGWGAKVQIAAFRRSGLEVVSIWARSATKAKEIATQYNVPFGSEDLKAVIERDNVNLVSIVTPPSSHLEITKLALSVGKHVLCEKPTALNAKEAEAMLQVSLAFPKQIALIDHELRFLPSMVKAKELIKQGKIGEIFFVDAEVNVGGRLDPKREFSWWNEKEHGGGALGAIGSHLFDSIRYLTDKQAVSVCGVLQSYVKERMDYSGQIRKVTADDYCSVQVQYPNGINGLIKVSVVKSGPSVHKISIVGNQGTLTIEGAKLLFSPPATSGSQVAVETLEDDEKLYDKEGPIKDIWNLGTVLIGEALLKAISTGATETLAKAATFTDGIVVQRFLDATRESDEKKQWVNL